MPFHMPRILIADDNAVLLRSLRVALSGHAGWMICGEAANGRQAVALAEGLKPDVVVLDVTMPEQDGLDAAVEILRAFPSMPIVLFTMYETEALDNEASRAGVHSVISKSKGVRALIAAIEDALTERPQ